MTREQLRSNYGPVYRVSTSDPSPPHPQRLTNMKHTLTQTPLSTTQHALQTTGSPTTKQWLRVGLYTPTILGGNSHLSYFYGSWAIKELVHKGTINGVPQPVRSEPIGNSLLEYATVFVTSQRHGLSAAAWTHYVLANEVSKGLHALTLKGS